MIVKCAESTQPLHPHPLYQQVKSLIDMSNSLENTLYQYLIVAISGIKGWQVAEKL